MDGHHIIVWLIIGLIAGSIAGRVVAGGGFGCLGDTIVGLAGDWCVKSTAIDGVRLGYRVTVPLALTRFVGLNPGDAAAAVEQMADAGVMLIASG